jgi:putative SOS response-associated peptidase YedK
MDILVRLKITDSKRPSAKTLTMCGRFSLATTKEKLQKQLPFVETIEELRESYNVAPTQQAYVITDEQPDKLQSFKWGLVPSWAKDAKGGGRLINARMEGIEDKPSFRTALRKRRCLVPADSFYEWKKSGKVKIPYRIMLKTGRLLCFAGLWEGWYKEEEPLKTFTIITTLPNKEMSELHDRMPVVLHTKAQQQKWLEAEDIEEVLPLLETPPDDLFKVYRVSTEVNSPVNNYPELHEEVKEPEKEKAIQGKT